MNNLVFAAVEAACAAGQAIMEVYAHSFEVYTKEDDNLVEGAVVGESDRELCVAVYLKTNYKKMVRR